MTGVIGHIANPTAEDCVELAITSESAGASWIGLADAFWWRDVWMQLAAVAATTSTIEIGPAMTNPYMRHTFHTLSGLATLQEMAPGRTLLGVTAGGSEVTAAAGLSRVDAPERVGQLIGTLRRVSAGGPLDVQSGRTLEVPLQSTPVLMAARGDNMLRTAGRLADRILLWAIPDSDLERSIGVIEEGASDRPTPPTLIWAPLVRHDDSLHDSLMQVAVYASLNTRPSIRRAWGLDDELVEGIRAELVRGGTMSAAALVPAAALTDLVLSDREPRAVATRAIQLGVSEMAVPGYGIASVPDHIAWALAVETWISRASQV